MLSFIFFSEIPEWLQVYAKASPDLDKFLKVHYYKVIILCTNLSIL